ncbi:Protein tyrosine/serine phosphatase [Dethiosulfatibacter aminovorans DSM 17477]|uniref:Protein tyrosine/serine phosphatase n=1 Tax=Dethiosulfatibacter aminovorans DSM 17477 TaxID=1121476 RepID=A0A1M6JW91_9FIRM|nr:tyrosine-protein phosphatase [Dethiosulfatibacter aminovorans]SHJ50965.1 Protein tyrosine/serine phosphatase [Dethiosulfatibacter aminovorans DSM 17477]
MKQMKRSLSLVLVVMMILSMVVTVYAVEDLPVLNGIVVEVQKYGNLTLDIAPSAFYDAGYELGDVLEITVGDNVLELPFVTSYSDVDTGSLLVRDDKGNDIVVVAINMGNFSTTYGVEAGDEVSFALVEKEGYLSEYLLRQLTRTYVREDYATDSIYANFRSIATEGINPGLIYRSCSPVNNELNRAAYSDALAEAVGIETVVNLADSIEELEGFMAEEGFKSDYYKSLYEDRKVILLDMDVDVAGEEFGAKLVEGFKFIIDNEGPYLIHCTEGKDRAGFASALLEALMGASLDEIVADYMTTYENYYGIEKGSEQYDAIAESNIITSMTMVVAGLEKGSDLTDVDLAEAAEDYLKDKGMTGSEISDLKEKLSGDPIYKSPMVMGEVLEIEKYGHASTDILIEDFRDLGFEEGDMVAAVFDNGFVLEAPFLDGYYVDTGYPLVRAYPGHTNIAVCINYGKLNEIADVEVGDMVTIMLTESEGYQVQYEIRKLERTNNREDYGSDEIFANFRNISLGTVAEGVLYRSSSPINNELGRAAYSDMLIKGAGVKAVVNMADSAEDIAEYRSAEDFNSPYYASLYDNGQVMTLNMNLAYGSDEFRDNIVKGLIFMSENEGPFLVHCTEGKDRAGFMSAFIEALMGATKDEIVADYMQSYINYYGVETGTEKYEVITGDVLGMLGVISDADDLDAADLASDAEVYLMAGGMTADQIAMLKTKLSTPVEEEEIVVEPVLPVVPEVPSVPEEPAAKDETITYVVVSGDCLWRIAQEYLGDGALYTEIYELNMDIISDPDLIYVGQTISIPVK